MACCRRGKGTFKVMTARCFDYLLCSTMHFQSATAGHPAMVSRLR
jgi:hypothetical protein